jgi:hypothetical protein
MKKIVLLTLIATFASALSFAQTGRVGIGTSTPEQKLDVAGNAKASDKVIATRGFVAGSVTTDTAKAVFATDITNKGFYIPRLTTSQKGTLGATLNSSNKGLLVFDTNLNRVDFWDGTAWKAVGDGAGGPPSGAAGGDLTGTYPNPNIANNAVTGNKILDGTITSADLATPAVNATNQIFNTLPVANGGTGVNTVTGAIIGNGSSAVSGVAASAGNQVLRRNNANTAYEFAQVQYSDVAGTPSALPPSGAAGGDLTGTYPDPAIAPGAVSGGAAGDILDNSITADDIAANAVGTSEIANSAVTYAKIQNVSANRLLGNPTGSATSPSEIALGTGLNFSGSTLNVSASGIGGWTTTGNSGTTPSAYADGTAQTGNFMGSTDNQAVEIYTNSSANNNKTDLRLYNSTSTGNVATAPSDILHIRRNGTTGVNYPQVASFALGKYGNSITSESELAIKLGAGSTYASDMTVMTMRANGNVGIGITSPSYPLDIAGSARISQNNATGGGLFLADDGSMVDLNDGYASMRFSNGVAITNGLNTNTHRILLRSDGNIQMLNSASPTINFNDNNNQDYYWHANDDRMYLLRGEGYNGWDGNRPFTAYQGNKIGINETSPSHRLQVNGSDMISLMLQQNGTHSYGIVEGIETFDNGNATQDGPRIGFHKRGAKTWASGIEPYGDNGFGIWEDGYNGQWGNLRVAVKPGGTLEARNGLRTQKKYTYYRGRANEDNAYTYNIGDHDMCYLAGVSFYMDNNVTWDIDNQCNVYPTDWDSGVWGDGGNQNQLYTTGPITKAYDSKPSWRMYVESFIDNDAVYCGAICIDFD